MTNTILNILIALSTTLVLGLYLVNYLTGKRLSTVRVKKPVRRKVNKNVKK